MTNIKSEEEIKKFLMYSKDPVAFIRDFSYGLNAISRKKETLNLYDFQIDIINHLQNNKFNILKKSRQMYVTQLMAAYAAWNLIFKFDFNIFWLSNKAELSINSLEKIKEILKNCPSYIFDWETDVVFDKKKEIRLSNNSSIKAQVASVNSFRGYRPDFIIIDEAAFINDKTFMNFWPIVCVLAHYNFKVIIASTPRHINFFYKVLEGAIKGENNFAPININWTMNPSYTKNLEIRDGKEWSPWYENMCKTLNYDESKIKRELWAEFSENIKPSSMRVNFRLDTELYEKMIDKIGNKNISDYLRELIKKDMDCE